MDRLCPGTGKSDGRRVGARGALPQLCGSYTQTGLGILFAVGAPDLRRRSFQFSASDQSGDARPQGPHWSLILSTEFPKQPIQSDRITQPGQAAVDRDPPSLVSGHKYKRTFNAQDRHGCGNDAFAITGD
jgi:hypothetical protein